MSRTDLVPAPSAMGDFSVTTEDDFARLAEQFRLLPDETLARVLDGYAEVARRTDELVAGLADLDVAHPLPKAPWFAPGEHWSARRVILHVIAETGQHAGAARILDGRNIQPPIDVPGPI